MAECKGLVKLFGKTILVPPDEEDGCCCDQADYGVAKEDCNHSLVTAATPRDCEPPGSEETNEEATASSTASNDQKPSTTPNADQDAAATAKPSNLDPDDNNANNSQSKPPLKKPDKILPCPRCSSLDTKFCYFNNYNVNQPRHFCKNCQRYWTDGGNMRNVPVGAGRRRSKNSAAASMLLNKHITVSANGIQTAVGPLHDMQGQQCTNGTMLCFDSEMVSGAEGSMAPVLTERITISPKNEEQRISHSARSSPVQSNPSESVSGIVQNCSDTSVQVPLNASSWGCNWSPAFPLYSNYYPPAFYPVGQCWGLAPWIAPGMPPLSSPPSNTETRLAEPPCPSLGKHSRDEVHLKDTNLNSADRNTQDSAQEKSLWMPKTLRITDPEEAAMSSIWLSIGIKKGKGGEDVASGGMFKGFQSKAKPDAKISAVEISQHIKPNPAALSRSHNFQERLC